MAGKVTVTYFHHSGFTVAAGDTLLVFDYWRGDHQELSGEKQLGKQDFEGFKQAIVFISHDHEDHFDEIVYSFDAFGIPVTYLVGYDFPNGKRGKRMKVGDEVTVDDVTITAYPSTDRGVSFLVKAGGVRIFHAGDLNLWHWREESTLREIAQSEEDFARAMDSVRRLHIDLCMFPLDPRLGGMFDAGANHFIMAVKPRVFIPMHWQGRTEVAVDYARRARTKYTETLALTQPREKVQIDFEENSLTIRTFNAEKRPAPKQEEVALNVLSPNDPFSDTDLPVSLQNHPM